MATLRWVATLLLSLLIALNVGEADINMHNPRGSNNRHKEKSRPRANANRLFDSQNNQRGGHNVGEKSLYFLSGSQIEVQWTSQHSCADQNNNCEFIIQYMCGDHLKDGKLVSTIPIRHSSCKKGNCDTDDNYGQHEKLQYYRNCESRARNRGLFVANQAVRDSSRSTRQNPTGQRRGLECPEERDYYPYWGFSPWKDIAILTNDVDRCPYYKEQSQNVKSRSECVFPDKYWQVFKGTKVVLHQTRGECENSKQIIGGIIYTGKWVTHPAHGIKAPDCRKTQWQRDNHQGNTYGGEFSSYVWQLPDVPEGLEEMKCVLRIRYNISTNDFDSWNVDHRYNGANALPHIRERFELSAAEAASKGYTYTNNPLLEMFRNWIGSEKISKKVRLQLSLDTSQYGRTFQDRSHVFHIRRRPEALRGKAIHNLNVRGKRGNIVQVYPSVEYDFVPNTLLASEGDYVHIQWTGSDTNPKENAGQGEAGTDRSNIVRLKGREFPKGVNLNNNRSLATNYPSNITSVFGFDWKATEDLAFLGRCTGPDPLLDKKSAYFDLGPQQITSQGIHYYYSTRNNQFSNRNQKAKTLVAEGGYDRDDGGISYRGYVKTTSSGEECKLWDSPSSSFQHQYNSEDFKDADLYFNYCRNPEGSRDLPWCYVSDRSDDWEYCEIAPNERKVVSVSKRSIEEEEMKLAAIPNTDFDQSFSSE